MVLTVFGTTGAFSVCSAKTDELWLSGEAVLEKIAFGHTRPRPSSTGGTVFEAAPDWDQPTGRFQAAIRSRATKELGDTHSCSI